MLEDVLYEVNGKKLPMPLFPHGIQSYKAHYYIHMCFDDEPEIGRQLHLMSVLKVRKVMAAAMRDGKRLVLGSRNGSAHKDTGAGLLFRPKTLGAASLSIDGLWDGDLDTHDEAVRITIKHLESFGYRQVRRARLSEDVDGIDVIAMCESGYKQTFEVKSRGKTQKQPYLFIQTHECNPGRLYK